MQIKQIEGYPSGEYFINESGTVMDKYGQVIESYMSNDGSSKMVDLRNSDGRLVHESVGELVGQIYVHNPDPDVFTTLIYRDSDPDNTYYDNLMWSIGDRQTSPEPVRRKTSRKKSSKKSKKSTVINLAKTDTAAEEKTIKTPNGTKYYEINKTDGSSILCRGLDMVAGQLGIPRTCITNFVYRNKPIADVPNTELLGGRIRKVEPGEYPLTYINFDTESNDTNEDSRRTGSQTSSLREREDSLNVGSQAYGDSKNPSVWDESWREITQTCTHSRVTPYNEGAWNYFDHGSGVAN